MGRITNNGAAAGAGHAGLARLRRSCARLAASERGDTIMLEAIIIWPTMTFLLLLAMGMYSYMYQVWNMNILANDTAARFGLMFRYYDSVKSTITGEIDVSKLEESNPYRYYKLDRPQLEAAVQAQADTYLLGGSGLLSRSAVGRAKKPPTVTTRVVSNTMARNHIEVRIDATYDIPFLAAIFWFGGTPPDHIIATGYADCLDLSDYIVTTNYARSMSGKVDYLRSAVIRALYEGSAGYAPGVTYETLTPADKNHVDDLINNIGTRAYNVQRLMQTAFE